LYGNRIIAENIFVASKGTKRQEYEENWTRYQSLEALPQSATSSWSANKANGL
jgi:hypothetical protein